VTALVTGAENGLTAKTQPLGAHALIIWTRHIPGDRNNGGSPHQGDIPLYQGTGEDVFSRPYIGQKMCGSGGEDPAHMVRMSPPSL